MPCEFRLLQLGGEAFSLDIPLYRIMGRESSNRYLYVNRVTVHSEFTAKVRDGK